MCAKNIRWSICLPSYNNFLEVYFTVQSLRLHHDMSDKEIVIADNYGDDGLLEFVERRGDGVVRYERACEVRGVSAAKNAAIQAARGEFVLCMDSHILLKQGCFDKEPCGDDLIQGPCLMNNLRDIGMQWLPVWRANMWGIWDYIIPRKRYDLLEGDERKKVEEKIANKKLRVADLPDEPYKIWATGAGFFACRRASWLRFNPKFRGFGGETGYLQEKYRKAGREVWCYPNMLWVHYFCNTGRHIPFPVIMAERVRNYLIGFNELGLDISPVISHFGDRFVKAARALDGKGEKQ